jgi:hypothetical protein
VRLTENELIQKLLSLELPPDDYAIFGSGLLIPYGLKESVPDLDVVARREAWRKASKLASPQPAPSGKGSVIRLFSGTIDIFDQWTPGEWDVNRLIDDAEVIEGVKFVRPRDVLKSKRLMGRPKDIQHITLLERYLQRHEK